jgi:hypothetical protein
MTIFMPVDNARTMEFHVEEVGLCTDRHAALRREYRGDDLVIPGDLRRTGIP